MELKKKEKEEEDTFLPPKNGFIYKEMAAALQLGREPENINL